MSCDILVGLSGNTELLVIVDCTLNVSDETKNQKLRNTADYLIQVIGKMMPDTVNTVIIPLLISFVDCTRYSSVAQKYQVKPIDKSDIKTL